MDRPTELHAMCCMVSMQQANLPEFEGQHFRLAALSTPNLLSH